MKAEEKPDKTDLLGEAEEMEGTEDNGRKKRDGGGKKKKKRVHKRTEKRN